MRPSVGEADKIHGAEAKEMDTKHSIANINYRDLKITKNKYVVNTKSTGLRHRIR